MQLGGKAEQLLSQVRDGVVDIAWALPGFQPGVMPKLEIFELPFLHRSTYATVMALQDYVPKYMKKDFEPYHVLLVHCHAGALFMTKDPINKVEDFKGMKLRSYSRTNAWILEALGAVPLQVALPELAPMLSKGTVTGSILPYEIAPSVKMQDLTNYFTTLAPPQPRLSTAIFTFLMNKQKYESLPPDLKKVIDDNSGRNLAPTRDQDLGSVEVEGEKVMHSKAKNKFVQLSPEETAKFKKKVQPVFDRFNKLLDDSAATTASRSWPKSRRWRRSIRSRAKRAGRASTSRAQSMSEQATCRSSAGRSDRPGPLRRRRKALAIFGGVLCCIMAAIVTVSVTGRYLFAAPIPGDYDIVAILCGCAVFAFLPYCQMMRGNVVVDFFTDASSRERKPCSMRSATLLYLAVAILFTWRLYYGVLELRHSGGDPRQFQLLSLVDHSVRSLLHDRPHRRDRVYVRSRHWRR